MFTNDHLTKQQHDALWDLIWAFHDSEVPEAEFHAALRDHFNYPQDEIDRMRMWWNVTTALMHRRPPTADDVIIEVLAGENIPLYRMMFGDSLIEAILADRDNLAWVARKRAERDRPNVYEIHEDGLPF